MSFITILQIIVSILLSLCILVQQRAAGLSTTLGGMGGPQIQRRGGEKVIFQATIVLSALFFILAIVEWYL